MQEPLYACKIGQLPRVPVDYLRCRQFMDAVLLAGGVPGLAAVPEDVEVLRTLFTLPEGSLAFRGVEAGFFQLSCDDATPVVFVCDDDVGYFGISTGDVLFLVHNNDGAKVRYVLNGEKRKYIARDNLVTQASFQLTALQVQGLQLFAHIVANCNGSPGSSRVELWATGHSPAVTVLVQAGKYAAHVLETAAPALAAAAVQRPRSKKRPRPEVMPRAVRRQRQEDTYSMPGNLAFSSISGSLGVSSMPGSLAFTVRSSSPSQRCRSSPIDFGNLDLDAFLAEDTLLPFSLDVQLAETAAMEAEVLIARAAAEVLIAGAAADDLLTEVVEVCEEVAVPMYVCLFYLCNWTYILTLHRAGFLMRTCAPSTNGFFKAGARRHTCAPCGLYCICSVFYMLLRLCRHLVWLVLPRGTV